MALSNKRAAQAKYRAGLYAQGVLTLEEFMELERDDDIAEAAARDARLNATLPQDLREALEDGEPAKPAEPKPAPKKNPDGTQSLVGLTKEVFNSLSLAEQSSLYEKAPDYVRRIVEDRPAYKDLIEPKREQRSFKGTTLEEFKKMSIAELSELADTDRELYDRLQAQSTGGSK